MRPRPRRVSPSKAHAVSAPIEFRTLGTAAKARIFWSFLWRGLIATAASAFIGKLMGVGAGVFALAIGRGMGLAAPQIKLLAQLSGLAVGIAVSLVCFYLYVRWLLEARLGGHRLMLVVADAPAPTPPQPAA